MSGGSYNYAYRTVEDAAYDIRERADQNCPDSLGLRIALADHLLLVAAAMKAIEWVDSCDWGAGDENAAIRAVLGIRSDDACDDGPTDICSTSFDAQRCVP